MQASELEQLREVLAAAGVAVRRAVTAARESAHGGMLAEVSHRTSSDTIFRVDVVAEEAVLDFFRSHWPETSPAELVMEGCESGSAMTFPEGIRVAETRWKVIVDPVDGTRGWMRDKRPAWFLAGVAPQRGAATRLADIQLASMTELPVTKQGFADQLSAVRGQGRAGIRAARHCLLTGGASTFSAVPSSATGFANGFGGLVRYFPPGKAEIAAIEGRFWEEVLGPDAAREALVFEDQYASTGGQIYELVTGRDLMVADIRPLVFARLGYGEALSCHPYDLCTALILEEAGGVIEHPVHRGQVDAPLDTVTPVAWAGYANRTLADRAAPVLARLLDAFGR